MYSLPWRPCTTRTQQPTNLFLTDTRREQAIDTADDAGRIAFGILGDKNGRAKNIARLKGEHRKLFMKCSASGFSVQVRETPECF